MDFDELRDQTCASLRLLLPEAGDSSRLVDECLSSARRSFKDEFILRLSPAAWARISVIYITTFLDTGADVSVGEICAAVLRDSININRMGILAQDLGQIRAEARPKPRGEAPTLSLVRSDDGEPHGEPPA